MAHGQVESSSNSATASGRAMKGGREIQFSWLGFGKRKTKKTEDSMPNDVIVP